MSRVPENNQVPITLTLSGGDEDRFPRAFIFNEINSLLSTIDLSHSFGGKYDGDTVYFMPSNAFVNVLYIVYEDSLRTLEDQGYARIDSTFFKDTTSDEVWDSQISDHLTPGSTGDTLNNVNALDIDTLLQALTNSDIRVVVESDELGIAVIELNEIIKVVINLDDSIAVNVNVDESIVNIEEENKIIGVIDEC